MRENHKGRKNRRPSQSQSKTENEAKGNSRTVLNTNTSVSTGYIEFLNQEESTEKPPKEETSRILTRRSKKRANHHTSEKSSRRQKAVEIGEKDSTRKRIAMEDRPDLDMEETGEPDTTMQSILRHLGPGFEFYAPQMSVGGSASRVRSLITMMKSDDINDQMTGISELCEFVSASTEESMIMFPTDQIVPVLLELLDSSPEIMLLSCRALTLLLDVLPSSARQISSQGGIETLCGKLVCIEYIDVAEQSIQALDKISHIYAETLLERGAINAILSFVDFFQVGVQRIAVNTAAKICAALHNINANEEIFSSVDSAVLPLKQLVFSSDNQICLSACEALVSISLSCKQKDRPIESVIGLEFLQQVVQKASSTIKPCVFYSMLRLLSESANLSEQLCIYLLDSNIIHVISEVISSLSNTSDKGIKSALIPRDSEEIQSLLVFIDNILPPVLHQDLRVFKSQKKQILKNISRLECHSNMFMISSKGKENIRNIFVENPGRIDALCAELVYPILEMDFASLPRKSRGCLLSILDKLLFYSTAEYLTTMISESPIPAFMIRLLQASDCLWIFCCLKLTSSLLEKGDRFRNILLREGILNEIKKISDDPQSFASDGQVESLTWFTKRIRMCYLPNQEMVEDQMEGLASLKKIKRKFSDPESLKKFLLLVVERSVSPFEVYSSKILEDLYSYLSDGGSKSRFSVGNSLSAGEEHVIKVITCGNMHLTKSLERLVDMVQEVLMTCENFPVYSACVHNVRESPTAFMRVEGSGNLNRVNNSATMDPFDNGLKALASPLRIRLCSSDQALTNLNITIMIEPLATVAQLQAYLKPRIRKVLKRASEVAKKDDNTRMTRAKAKSLGYRKGMGKSDPGSASNEESEKKSCISNHNRRNDGTIVENDGSESQSFSCEDNEDDCQELGSVGDVKQGRSTVKDTHGDFSIAFSVDGIDLEPSTTLLNAFLERQPRVMQNCRLDLKYVWTQTHQIDFLISFGNKSEHFMDAENVVSLCSGSSLDASAVDDSKGLENILSREDEQVRSALGILKSLERIWMFAKSDVSSVQVKALSNPSMKHHLINNKICSKLRKQLKDPLLVCSRALPGWCSILPHQARFLFSRESRSMYFRYHAFGLGRTVLAMVEDAPWHSGSGRESQDSLPFAAPRISRQKVRISRLHVLESARKVFERYADADSRLEVEFYGEVGSGLGPTLEFYTLLSRELQSKNLKMWKGGLTSEDPSGKYGDDLVVYPLGLFPQPMNPNADQSASDVISNFLLLGKVVGKAIQDGRLLDMPFCKSFYKLAVRGSLDEEDLNEIDPYLFRSLNEIKSSILRSNGSTVMVKGVPIEEMCLHFVLPGDETFELCPGGANILVTSQNASAYVESVFKTILSSGVEKQLNAFRKGLNGIFPIHHLEIFYEDEIDAMVCGDVYHSDWTFEMISSAIRCDHGYSSDSIPIINLIEVLVDLDNEDKRRFLKFVTGSPRLPVGGFLALNPRLTIVRKGSAKSTPASPGGDDVSSGEARDNDLPSVMTCANYFKLPPYSSKQILKDRLLFAIREGQGSFDLS